MTGRDFRKGRFLLQVDKFPSSKEATDGVPWIQCGIHGPRSPSLFFSNTSRKRKFWFYVWFWLKPEPPKQPVNPNIPSSKIKELKEWLAQGAPGSFKADEPERPPYLPVKETRFYQIWDDEDYAPLAYGVYLYLGRDCHEFHLKSGSRRIIIGRGFSRRR